MCTSETRLSSGHRDPSRHVLLVASLGALMSIGALVSIAGCTKSGNLGPGSSGAEGVESVTALACVAPASSAERDVVCSRWACGHAELFTATWDGDPKTCASGTIDARAQDRALALVNAYRFLAGVPEVVSEPRWDGPAQECALLAHANRQLSHSPPRDWSCWSDRAARASAVSLVANRSAPLAIDPFIEDPGNAATMVHRRWLLSEKVRRLGVGSTSGFTCALVDGREWDGEAPPAAPESDAGIENDAGGGTVEKRALAAPPAWVAWPPPGPVPIDAFRRTKVDRTGWTIQSSSLDLDGAVVEIHVAGEARPISVSPLERTMGSLTAIRFVPQGWSTEPDERYDVHVAKGDLVIDYAVEPIVCP